MSDDPIASRARAAALDKALAAFPGDVAAAMRSADGFAAGIQFPPDPADEPWPAMDVSVGRAGVSP